MPHIDTLAVYKIPDYIIPVTELPMTGSGKIDLKATKELAERQVKELQQAKHPLREDKKQAATE